MYNATIDSLELEIETGANGSVNGDRKEMFFEKLPSGGYRLIVQGEEKIADVVKFDVDNKTVTLRMEGKKYTVQLKEPIDLLLNQLGINQKSSRKLNQLKAPMPGLVIKILAVEGQHYKAGDPLLILEAMKMENVFKAASDVTIKQIQIVEKQTVEKGQLLMIFE